MRRHGGPILAVVMAGLAIVAAALPGGVAARDPEPLPAASLVSVGPTHTCALWWNGLSCWGDNNGGMLGNGTGSGSLAAPIAPPVVEPQSVVLPRTPSTIRPFAAVDAGPESTCAIANGQGGTTPGTLWCWGDTFAALGRVCVGGDLGGPSDPAVVMAGPIQEGTDAECGVPLQGVVRVAAGESGACAIVRTEAGAVGGRVWCWGMGDRNALLASPLTDPDGVTVDEVIDIDVSDGRYCALGLDGAVTCWADVPTPRPAVVAGLAPAVAIAVGVDHACAQVEDGGVWCWGADDLGQLGDGTTTTYSEVPVRVIGLEGTDAARLWPADELPYGPRILAAGDDVTCVLRDQVAGAPRAAVSAWCWGANDRGQLGDGSRDGRSGAVKVAGLDATEGLFDLAVGGSSACVVTGEQTSSAGTDPTLGGLISTNALRCWGGNDRGQLGVGDWSDRSTPTLVVMTEEPRLRE